MQALKSHNVVMFDWVPYFTGASLHTGESRFAFFDSVSFC